MGIGVLYGQGNHGFAGLSDVDGDGGRSLGLPLTCLHCVGEKVAQWGESHMGNEYSYVGAVVGATYPEMGKTLRKIMPKTFILVPGYGAQGGKGADLVHFFNEDGLGAIVNSSRGIIAAYKQEKYASFGELNYADASRQAVKDMIEDISTALNNR